MEAIKSFQELEEWIKLQQLVRWIISYDKVDSGDKPARVACQAYADKPQEDNLEYTENCLKFAKGQRLYIRGWRSEKATVSPCYAEILIPGSSDYTSMPQPMQQMVGAAPSIDKDQLMADIRKQIQVEFDAKEIERKRKELDAERKSLDDEKNSFMGVMAHYFAPVAQALMAKAKIPVTGIEQTAGGEVIADTISPAEQEDSSDDVFTDEEAAELESLLERLKIAEPEYMQLLRRVVELAEAKDGTYTMARGFLLK